MKSFRMFTFITGILVLLFIFLPISKVTAAEGDLYMVRVDKLNMRSAPSHEAQIIGQLEYKDQLMVFAEENGWGKTFYEGEKVWVALEFVQSLEKKPDEEDEVEVEPNRDDVEAEEVEEENTDSDKVDNSDEQAKTIEQHDQSEPEAMDKNDEEIAETEIADNEEAPVTTHGIRAKINQQKKLPPVKTMKPKSVKISKHALSIMDSLANFQIVIDAGHGGKDAGAIKNGIFEKNLTLLTAKKVADHLKKAGASVTMTRTDDSFVSLAKRVHISEIMQADAFISIHYDSFSDTTVQGLASHYYADQQSKKLAQTIQQSLTKHIGMENRGVRHSNLFVLRENNQKAILLELGFMTNPSDWKTIRSEQFRDKVADAIVQGLHDYFK